eukprot:COSAG05_NODE_1063_length_5992_cov_6.381470_5_plen_81_part_00
MTDAGIPHKPTALRHPPADRTQLLLCVASVPSVIVYLTLVTLSCVHCAAALRATLLHLLDAVVLQPETPGGGRQYSHAAA